MDSTDSQWILPVRVSTRTYACVQRMQGSSLAGAVLQAAFQSILFFTCVSSYYVRTRPARCMFSGSICEQSVKNNRSGF